MYNEDKNVKATIIELIGNFKLDNWNFENEVRDILNHSRCANDRDEICYFLDIKEEMLKKIEITCGPRCSKTDINRIKKITENKINVKPVISKLKIRKPER